MGFIIKYKNNITTDEADVKLCNSLGEEQMAY